LAHPELRGLGLIRADGLPPLPWLPTAGVRLRVILPSFFLIVARLAVSRSHYARCLSVRLVRLVRVSTSTTVLSAAARSTTTGRSRGCIRQVCIITMRGVRNVRVGWLALVISGASGRSTSARRRHNTIPLGSLGGIRASVTTWDQSTGRATLFPRAVAPIAAPLPSPPPFSLWRRGRDVDRISGTRGSRMRTAISWKQSSRARAIFRPRVLVARRRQRSRYCFSSAVGAANGNGAVPRAGSVERKRHESTGATLIAASAR